ncbi:hypothetical protein AB0E63_18960 [Kribbella sp. NPDC026596]|uniref:hypothetical protein n=1 Tax=Kribbella sp. NPDC026596 TaxID=3155122 RepID=UPI0034040E27
MIAVLVLLTVSVLIEQSKTKPRCWQESISAYYYTPAHAVFVCSVLAIGVCMIVLKGNTKLEDVLLNIGGMFAPVVALVPTPGAGTCWSEKYTPSNVSPNIANNIWALFAAGGLALLLSLWIRSDAKRKAKAIEGAGGVEEEQWGKPQNRALVASGLILIAGVLWFAVSRSSFEGKAHYVAAVAFFVLIIWIVGLNALHAPRNPETGQRLKRRVTWIYRAIAALMAICVIYSFVGWWRDWTYSLLHVEIALILLFLAFWVTQTKELWTPGVRPPDPGADRESEEADVSAQ